MCEWGEDEVIRNDNEVEKAEQGQTRDIRPRVAQL
jgi:hypothetical protein